MIRHSHNQGTVPSLAALVVAVLVCAGCGGEAEPAPTAMKPAAMTAAPPTATTEPASPTATASPTVSVMPEPVPAGHIAYVDPDGQVQLVRTDGQLERTLPAGQASSLAWSPDGRMLAYIDTAGGWSYVRVHEVANWRTWQFGEIRDFLARISWSPDGRYLALESGTSTVRRLEIAEARTQTFVSPIEAVGYAWSPDGTRLAIGRRQPVQPPLPYEIGDSLSLAVLEPGRTPRVILEGTSDVLYRPLAWLSDGRILYLRTDWPDKSRAGQDSLWTARLDGEAVDVQPARDIPPADDPQALLALLPAGLRDTVATGSSSWAPDGRWLAFDAGYDPHRGIYLFDALAGGTPERLADGTSPAWRPGSEVGPLPTPDYRNAELFTVYTSTSTSPDGLWTVVKIHAVPEANGYSTGDRDYIRLTVARSDGATAWTLVDEWRDWGLGYTTPEVFHWSRDGRSLYFTNRPHPDGCPYFVNGSDLFRVDLQDGRVTEVAPALGMWLALSPDERTLAAAGSGRLVLRDLVTGEQRELALAAAGVYVPAGETVWSPDGSALVLTVSNDACVPTAHSIVRVEAATLAVTTLVDSDSRLLTSEAWPEAGRVLLADGDGGRWWMDAKSGELTRAE